jgi:hypothetical protein
VSLLAVLMERTLGKRDGKSFSHIRYKATLALGSEADLNANGAAIAETLARVEEIDGAAGPWAVTGYRMGERALKELELRRQS